MLRRLAVPVLAVTLALALSGCFQFLTVLKLNPDGSGTVEQSLYLASFFIAMVQSGDSTATLYTEEDLRARADSFGAGVRFVRVEEAARPGYEGYRAVYAFDDVNTVRLRFDADALDLDDDTPTRDDIAPDAEEDDSEEDASSPSDALQLTAYFDYAPSERTLVIRIPHEEPEPDTIHPDTLAARVDSVRQNMDQGLSMVRAFLADARLTFAVEMPAPIASTDAQFADSTTVTLMDFELDKFVDLMLADPELAARMDLAQTEGARQTLLLGLGDREGAHLEQAEEITVRFE